jgi:hypothetical protein
MVSGFLTSPLDQMRIWSAVARPICSWSNMFTSSIVVPSLVLVALRAVVALALRRSSRRRCRARAADVDAELLGGAEDVLVELAHLDLGAVVGEHLDVDAERLHLLHEHLEALGHAGLGDVVALDDGLVDLDPAEHVVGLDGQQLLQAVRRAVGLEGPHLHLAEALAAELRLAARAAAG